MAINNQPKPGPDYSGQNLSGRSFRGQALCGAVFRNADLRGVDFREADLTRADFSGARMGKTWRRRMMEFPVQFLLDFVLISFSLAWVIGLALLLTILFYKVSNEEVFKKLDTSIFWALLTFMALQVSFIRTVRRGILEWFLFGLGLFIAIAMAIAMAMTRDDDLARLMTEELALTVIKICLVILYCFIFGYLSGVLGSAVAIAGAMAITRGEVAAVTTLLVMQIWALITPMHGSEFDALSEVFVVVGVASMTTPWWLSR